VTVPEAPPPITLDPRAQAMLLDVRNREPDAADLGLVVSIAGIRGSAFAYDLAFMRVDDAAPGDHVVAGALPVVIPAGDLESLRGAVITMSRNLLEPGLVVENPNSPSPAVLGDPGALDLGGPLAERVTRTIEEVINPAIAAHGGYAEVVAVEDATVYLRLGGGCQGCGMASVTLSQGIEATLRQAAPEIERVVDVTDHAGGENPYYEQAKK
jgi:Fe/S biogenesis protein NfuA